MGLKPFQPKHFRRRVFSQLWTMGLQFILGMALNLGDAPRGSSTHTFYVVILVAHILTGIGIIEGGYYIALKSGSRLSWWGALIVTITAASGALYVMTGSDWWSFGMAVGFLAAAYIYVALYVQADRALLSTEIS